MNLANNEKVSKLTQQIQIETDSKKLMELVAELTRVLDEMHQSKPQATMLDRQSGLKSTAAD